MRLRLSWAVVFLMLWLAARPGAAERGSFDYTTNSGAITITRYVGAAAEVVIPGGIEGIPVTRIGADAFYRRRDLTSITIPQSVTLIENRPFDLAVTAFTGCENLLAINVDPLNPAYASVDGVLFDRNQTNLLVCPEGKGGNYTIPASVTRIAERAFAGCGRLAGVTIPEGVLRMGNGAFSGCANLAAVTIPPQVAWLGSRTFAGCQGLTNVVISGPLTRIEEGAFSDCFSLTHLTIPASVTTVGEWAFSGCVRLTQIVIPASVTGIGPRAFAGCASLKAITVDVLNPAYSSRDGVLFDKGQTTLLACPEGKAGACEIPAGVPRIASGAFAGCGNLTGIAIPESVTSIGDRVFAACGSLTSIVIPGGITNIPGAAFEGCGNLANVTIPDSITSIDGGAFSGCTNLASITIPHSLTRIGDTAFSECVRLAKITTPQSVTMIETAAFQNCASLATATIRGNLTSLGNGPFYNCGNLTGVYFEGDAPGGLVATSPLAMFNALQAMVYYLPERAGWGTTFGARPTAPWQPRMESANLSLTGANQFGFTLTWASGKQVVVEACASLTKPQWVAVGTNTLTDGSSLFSLRAGTDSPHRFFLLRSP